LGILKGSWFEQFPDDKRFEYVFDQSHSGFSFDY